MGRNRAMMETLLLPISVLTPVSRLNAAMVSYPQPKNAMERSLLKSSKEKISRPVLRANRFSVAME
jgi:hypothetical protein